MALLVHSLRPTNFRTLFSHIKPYVEPTLVPCNSPYKTTHHLQLPPSRSNPSSSARRLPRRQTLCETTNTPGTPYNSPIDFPSPQQKQT
jgi:hypothetical protein